MAFLSSFRAGAETNFPEALRARLRAFPLLENVGETGFKALLSEANWFALPGGTLLDREGENDSALFLVVTGSLGVFVEDGKGGRRLVTHVPAGETVGEMSLIAGSTGHSAQIVALRDTELLRISPAAFEALVARHPRVMLNITRFLVRRLQSATSRRDGARPKTFAIVPLQDGLADAAIAHRLAGALREIGTRAAVLDSGASDQDAEWFNTFEQMHDVVFYRGDAPDSAWTQLCLRQADRSFLLAQADRPLPPRPLDLPAFKARASSLPELLLLQPDTGPLRLPEHFASRTGLFEGHHHVRDGHAKDIARLARFISGRAVGLVLAGGGARGFAHIGIIKALMEAGVPFDRLGGTSMGAIIAAGLAQEWSVEELTERMRAVFVSDNPLSDWTIVPRIALIKGGKVSAKLREHFGDLCIEELPRNFFAVSSDLTTGRIHVHRDGRLWRALRASVALPGILPPVVHKGHLLVDGGVMNNLPVDVMRDQEAAAGPIIACDITGEIDLQARDPRYGERPWWRQLWQGLRGDPSIINILMRSGTVGSEAQRRIVREQCDYLIEPPLPTIGLGDWKKFDQAIQEGYDATRACLEKNTVPLTQAEAEARRLHGNG